MKTVNVNAIFPVVPVNVARNMDLFVPSGMHEDATTFIIYPENDPYEREPHLGGFLKLPVSVPNFLELCQSDEQKPFTEEAKFIVPPSVISFLAEITNKDTGAKEQLVVELKDGLRFFGEANGTAEFKTEFDYQTNGLSVELVGYEYDQSHKYHRVEKILGVNVRGYIQSPNQ